LFTKRQPPPYIYIVEYPHNTNNTDFNKSYDRIVKSHGAFAPVPPSLPLHQEPSPLPRACTLAEHRRRFATRRTVTGTAIDLKGVSGGDPHHPHNIFPALFSRQLNFNNGSHHHGGTAHSSSGKFGFHVYLYRCCKYIDTM